jgi:mono/diheme cytochrome c family protein
MKKWLWMAVLFLPVCGYADESKFQLKDGPGRDKVAQNCGNCHSVDYIALNSVFLDRKGWEGSVAKMINAFGAPIAKDDVAAIVDYLTQNYGK